MLKETGDFILNLHLRCLGGPKLKRARVTTCTACCRHRRVNVPWQGGCDSSALDWRMFTPAEMSLPVSTTLCKQLHLPDHTPAQPKSLPNQLKMNHKPEGKVQDFPEMLIRLSKLKQLQLINLMKNICNIYSSVCFAESCLELTPEPGLSRLPFIYFLHEFLRSRRLAKIKHIMYNSCYGKCHYVCCLMRFSPEHC